MPDLLKGQVSIITGAACGMGKAIAKMYAREGASVGLLDVLEDELAQVVNEIQAEGGKAIGLVLRIDFICLNSQRQRLLLPCCYK